MITNLKQMYMLIGILLVAASCVYGQAQRSLDELEGQPANIAPSAYQYRSDRPAEENPPESWIGLMKYTDLPFDKVVDVNAPAVKEVLCGLFWEEVRRIRRVELVWSDEPLRQPKSEEILLTFFDAEAKGSSPLWWSKTALRQVDRPVVSADGRTFTFTIPVDTFGVFVSVRGCQEASVYAIPEVRAFEPEVWKRMDLELEWGFDPATAELDYSGRIEAYDGIVANIRPLAGDAGTSMKGANYWQSTGVSEGRRGVSLSLLYVGTSKIHKVWPFCIAADELARTIVTVWTQSGNVSFRASDLERGPILAPEYGFFVRAVRIAAPSEVKAVAEETASFLVASQATTAQEFIGDLESKNLMTIRERVRQHPEQTWKGAVEAMFPGQALPAIPQTELESPMKVEVPCPHLQAQWDLGAWHLMRHAVKNDEGRWRFNCHPYGILAGETYLILNMLDLLGMSEESADGLDQWLSLPLDTLRTREAGHFVSPGAKPDRPAGGFSDGHGCFTNAVGPPGVGGHMDGAHAPGPGAIIYAMVEHFYLTGDIEWLRMHASRMKANVEWILRQRKLLASIIPGGERLWCKGLLPSHQASPGLPWMHFYWSEAQYWLAVERFAQMLSQIDAAEGKRLAAEAQSYRQDINAALDRSIALSPVVLVRDGTYRPFMPFACYVRGFATGRWGWRHTVAGREHLGGPYWDAEISAAPMVDPAGLLANGDRRVQGWLDVLEDRVILANNKVVAKTKGFNPEIHWFSQAGWYYQPGFQRNADIYLRDDDAPNFLRSWLNQYASLIMPQRGYIFREHTIGGPPDKIFEEAAFLKRFRNMLVMEQGESLWLAKTTPRAWLEQGKKISVKNAPTHFGPLAYEMVSDVDHGNIAVTIEMPCRHLPKSLLMKIRHPQAAALKSVMVNGQPWRDFDKDRECIRIIGLEGKITVQAKY